MKSDKINRLFREIAEPGTAQHLKAFGKDGVWKIHITHPGKHGSKIINLTDDGFIKYLESNPESVLITCFDFERSIIYIPGLIPETREAFLKGFNKLLDPKMAGNADVIPPTVPGKGGDGVN